MSTEITAESPPLRNLPSTAQLILGADKRNPVFSVYRNSDREELQVYFGFELLETLADIPESPACKLLLARLYNAGVKLKALCETFGFDPKTIRRWGQALRRGDAEGLIRVLEGRASRRKLTAPVASFARLRWPELWADRRYGAVQRLRQEIQSVFRIGISARSLGPLIRELKAVPLPPAVAPLAAREASPVVALASGGIGASAPALPAPGPAAAAGNGLLAETEIREIASQGSPEGAAAVLGASPPAFLLLGDEAGVPPPDDNGKRSPCFQSPAPQAGHAWCDHAGLLIFAGSLSALSACVKPAQPVLAQWLSSLLLGAQNIEQTKFLNWEDLQLMLGQVVRFPMAQREQLRTLGTEATLAGLFAFNARVLGGGVGADFYFDPHTKHYTGEQNVLQGWCAKLRWADKILQSDFIHTASGAPLYFETTDNFEDLRARFFGVIGRARAQLQWPAERVVTYVVDRGIFGAEVFEKILADASHHLITWQKGFVAGQWEAASVSGSLRMTRPRNHSGDLRNYAFEYRDQAWEKNPRLRQIIVQATDAKDRVVQVAILTDDASRPAKEIILLMFQRWLQENDFKYLDKHFGINQITSYRVIEYDQLRDQVKDRQIKSSQRKLLQQRRQKLRQQQARLLLIQEQAEQRQRQREQQAAQLQATAAQDPASGSEPPSESARERKTIQAAQARHTASSQTRRQQIQQWSQTLSQLEAEITAATQTESRLEALIAAQMVRMEPHSKRVLDALRIIARNLFYQALQPFKKAYDNFRDDHDYFRKLSQSPGVLEFGKAEVVVHLMPVTNYAPAMRRIVCGVLAGLNQARMCFPNRADGVERTLRFRLGSKSEVRLHLELAPE